MSADRPRFTGDIRNGLPVLSGSRQEERLAPALRPGWFRLEERGAATLLSMGGQHAAKLCFHNAQGTEQGGWTALFQLDESAVFADFLNFQAENAEKDFLRTLDLHPEAAPKKILRLADLLEAWLGRLSSPRAEALLDQLHEAAGRLASELDILSAHVPEQISHRFPRLRSLHKQDSAAGVSLNRASGIREFFLRCHSAFHQVLVHLRRQVPPLWEESLRSGGHEPAAGLFIAFVQLYSKALAAGKSFPERHLDFYYWEALRAGSRAPQPDAAHLICRNVAGREALIRQGERFTAGPDAAGNERLYLADNDLRVTDVRVEQLLSVSFERSPLVSPAWEMGCFIRCRRSSLSAAAEPQPGSEPVGLSLFGEEKKAVSHHDAQDVQTGLLLAAPELLLGQGRREISVVLLYRQESNLDKLLEEMRKIADQERFFRLFGQVLSLHLTPAATEERIPAPTQNLLLQLAKAAGVASAARSVMERLLKESNEGNTLFYRFLTNAFYISLSAAAGWLPVRRYSIFPVAAQDLEQGCGGGLRLEFVLDRDAEPVVGCHPETHGTVLDTSLPLLRLRLNHQAHFFPYSIFQHCILRKVIIKTKVEGLRDLQAHNQHGRLDASQPFQPFGPAPARQSYCIIGSHEAAIKQLTDLSFCVEWAGLPDEPEGFAAYYRQYQDDSLTNAAFQADFSLLRNGRWVPEDKERRHSTALFAWRSMDGRLEAQQELAVSDLKQFQPLPADTPAKNFFYGPKQGSGFFRWELTGPKQAFGHSQYPELLSKVLMRTARSKQLNAPVPNPPYTPLVNALSLNYTARCEIDLSKPAEGAARIYHLHPFGIELLYPQAAVKSHAIVPRTDAAGNLYIGLRGKEISGLQALYFHLNSDSSRTAVDARPRISWFYAAETAWRHLDESHVLSDTTECFLRSGIVTLDIPQDASSENAELGQGLYWLRASTDRDPKIFSSVRGVHAQALRVTASQGGNAEPLAPQTVRQPFSTITGLSEVLQPEASFGGGGRKENREAVITRLSERLRHKDRAATPWDYERLVLEQFPQVRQVKCFPHLMTRPTPKSCPGSVLIAVVPETVQQLSCCETLPKIDAATLARIRDFLQRHASPFSRIEVRNPEYERIQIRCAVTFADRSSSGSQLARLHQAVLDYVSPWTATGLKVCFGWSLHLDDLRAHLSGLEGVRHVTDLSALHITKDCSNAYYLSDSARDDRTDGRIRPRYPWSTAVPMPKHYIRVLHESAEIAAEETGIEKLQIGETFIINE